MRPSGVLRSIVGTLLGGALVAFVATSIASALLAGGAITGRASEAPVARTFMVGVLTGDRNATDQLRPSQGIVARAQQAQNASGAPSWTPTGLSYLGGTEMNGVGVYVYVAAAQASDGSPPQMVPFTVTVSGGKVLRVQ